MLLLMFLISIHGGYCALFIIKIGNAHLLPIHKRLLLTSSSARSTIIVALFLLFNRTFAGKNGLNSASQPGSQPNEYGIETQRRKMLYNRKNNAQRREDSHASTMARPFQINAMSTMRIQYAQHITGLSTAFYVSFFFFSSFLVCILFFLFHKLIYELHLHIHVHFNVTFFST